MTRSIAPTWPDNRRARVWAVASVVLVLAALLGRQASRRWLMLVMAALGGVALLLRPTLGLYAIVAAALVVPLEMGTGTQVKLNAATLLIPAVFVLWLLDCARRRALPWAASRVNRPLRLFLAAGLLSWLMGLALWDPAVPQSSYFWLVSLAQWALFLFAALAFWLTANLVDDEATLQRLTWIFLWLGGGLAILYVLPGVGPLVQRVTTIAFIRAPFWALLTALAGGALLFDRTLSALQRVYLVALLVAVGYFAFVVNRESASTWVGVTAVAGVLVWLRWPRLRSVALLGLAALAASGVLLPSLYRFAGGEEEWLLSGGSRMALITRVVEVTLRNPLTGLGPAAYRAYAATRPLKYGRALWLVPAVNSHNNYVDLFSHTGLLGLGLFLWFAVELGLLGWRLAQRYRQGFLGGYVNGMLAAWVASLVLMLLADWILPFVYNIGFPGFQASLLVWLFLGGLVAVDAWEREEATESGRGGEREQG